MKHLSPPTALRISLLWAAVLLAMLFRDIHQFVKPGYLDEIADAFVPEWLFLLAGIVITIPILMIPLNQWFSGSLRRWANAGAAAITFLSAISLAPSDLDDWWFFAVEAVLLGVIVWLAWPQNSPEETPSI